MILKILKWAGAAIGVFALLVVAFVVLFLFQAEEAPPELAEEAPETLISSTELDLMTVLRDSLQINLDSLMVILAQQQAELDSLQDILVFRDAAVNTLESRLQDRDVEINTLRELDLNAKEMARTFATMDVDALTPIVSKLTDGVMLDIYKHTSNKRRRFLLTAMGDSRAAKLTNGLVKK